MVDEAFPIADARAVLQKLCQERGVDFASLSRLIGRNPAYIQQFIRRGTPRRLPEQERRILARHFDIPETLLGGEMDSLSGSGLVLVPALDENAGAGSAGTHRRPARMGFEPSWLRRLTDAEIDQLGIAQVEGDSMMPTLRPGDDVLVDRSDASGRMRDGLYLLRLEGSLQVKRLTLHPVTRRVAVQSDNPAYADWPDLKLEDLDPVGRVIWIGRCLD